MKRVMDIGNSRLKWADVVDRQLTRSGGLERDQPLEPCLDHVFAGAELPTSVLVASVAGTEFDRRLETWMSEKWGLRPTWFHSEPQTLGIVNGYADSARLGSDRWAAVIGARGLFPGPLGVIDAGTAVTLDAVGANDHHLGGLIFPGLDLIQQSLFTRTANIRQSTPGEALTLGRDTDQCVASGAILGLAGALERWMTEVEDLLGNLRWIGTGGYWPQLSGIVNRTVHEDPDLVLRGLARVIE